MFLLAYFFNATRTSGIAISQLAIEFKKTDTYYLTIAEKDGSGIPEKVEFTINIAFANDFDF